MVLDATLVDDMTMQNPTLVAPVTLADEPHGRDPESPRETADCDAQTIPLLDGARESSLSITCHLHHGVPSVVEHAPKQIHNQRWHLMRVSTHYPRLNVILQRSR